MKIRVLLVDQENLFRDGLAAALQPNFDVVAAVGSVSEAVCAVDLHQPDILVVAYRLPDGDGCSLVSKLNAVRWRPAMILASEITEEVVLSAIAARAMGISSRERPAVSIICGLLEIRAGGAYLCADATAIVLKYLARGPSVLSPRERQVLRGIAAGLQNKSISREIGVSVATVRAYRKTLMKKLGANNSVGLIIEARKHGLLPFL